MNISNIYVQKSFQKMILPKYWKENLFSDFVKYIVLFPFKKFATTKNNYHPSKIKSSSKNGTNVFKHIYHNIGRDPKWGYECNEA